MRILGIDTGEHDSSAALVIDGKLCAAVEEERFLGLKHAKYYAKVEGISLSRPSHPPINSIRYCLDYLKENYGDNHIDIVVFSWDLPLGGFIDKFKYAFNYCLWPKHEFLRCLVSIYLYTHRYLSEEPKIILNWIRKETDSDPKIVTVEHHIAHAASAYYSSGFKKANILTLDGRGTYSSGMIGFGQGSNIETISTIPVSESLGGFYIEATDAIGMVPNIDEGKVMGLAAYGSPKIDFHNLIDIKGNKISINKSKYRKWLEKAKKMWVNGNGKITEDSRKDIAATAQKVLEQAGKELARKAYESTGYRKIVLAGGVALNIGMNAEILASDFVDDIFIQPAANDAGTALGAALYVHVQETGQIPKFKMEHVYWGPSYSDDQIKKCLKEIKVSYHYSEDIEGEVANLLPKGKVVGWYRGRLEFGPRALGNRSILADPSKTDSWEKVNIVKKREKWRPFAPTILEKYGREYMIDFHTSPFMLLQFNVREEKKEEIQAVVHVDGTTRPQTLRKNVNDSYYKLINEFKRETNIPLILNTSLNLKGEPLARTPLDALRAFSLSSMDFIALGNFLVGK